ncbi:MAG: hypothetical protein ACRD51_06900, partial [Candidatus Acidiferrum sp.]
MSETNRFQERAEILSNRSRLRGVLLGLCLCSTLSGFLFAQERTAGDESAGGQEARTHEARQRIARGQPSGDLVTDNLGRVAATADQILELLKKDAGLMVEFKRLLAQDAGAAGQILDESALTDEAVSVRLNEDLRARVLATRLLQKYGYLLPKINPNSELAAERSLVLQDRAYAIAHAAERSSEPSALPPGAQAAGCDWQSSMDCDFAGQRTNPGYPSGKREGRQDYPQDQR